MEDNEFDCWSWIYESRAFPCGIKKSPYEALSGCKYYIVDTETNQHNENMSIEQIRASNTCKPLKATSAVIACKKFNQTIHYKSKYCNTRGAIKGKVNSKFTWELQVNKMRINFVNKNLTAFVGTTVRILSPDTGRTDSRHILAGVL